MDIFSMKHEYFSVIFSEENDISENSDPLKKNKESKIAQAPSSLPHKGNTITV